ncbi:hypothetical protein NQ314_015036 [Rhamnusium bicolor]|uniref:Uncharacterized protein n=1 Tax=Rhamnusium bicolor TaxID=1586634 RepID=A0AAV8WZD3_9CUCU|nr:hypothetical protein NQ314_015036 [Rhamnusium bicolor]
MTGDGKNLWAVDPGPSDYRYREAAHTEPSKRSYWKSVGCENRTAFDFRAQTGRQQKLTSKQRFRRQRVFLASHKAHIAGTAAYSRSDHRYKRSAPRRSTDDRVQLNERLSRCEALFNSFDVVQTEIEILDSSEAHQAERVVFENKYYKLMSKAKRSLNPNIEQLISSTSVADNNTSLSANLSTALQLLIERFQNRRLIIHNHIKNIFEFSPITKDSPSALRNLIDSVQRDLRALESMKEPVKQWSTLLIFLICTKLDSTSRKEWEFFSIKEDIVDFDNLMKFLKQRCQILETMESNKSISNINKNYNERKYEKNDNAQGTSMQRFSQNSSAHHTATNLVIDQTQDDIHVNSISQASGENSSVSTHSSNSSIHNQVLLSTARVLILDKNAHPHDTRYKLDSVKVPKIDKTTGQRSHSYLGTVIFNSLPANIKATNSFNLFKKKN